MAEPKTRAVEVAVIILLAACAVFATIGVYEGQQPTHTPAGWFTASAMALIVAVLVPLVVFGFFPWIERLAGKQQGMPATTTVAESSVLVPSSSPPLAEKRAAEKRAVTKERVIARVTPKYLTDFYEGRMDFEGDAAVQRFIGKWMRVSGPLKNVTDNQTLPNYRFMGVTLQWPNDDDPSVSMFFMEPKWFERLLVMKRGDPVSVFGRIQKVDRRSVLLDDCELVGDDDA